MSVILGEQNHSKPKGISWFHGGKTSCDSFVCRTSWWHGAKHEKKNTRLKNVTGSIVAGNGRSGNEALDEMPTSLQKRAAIGFTHMGVTVS
mmetsp:Transcript_3642/g.7606  ORF Transcript_3642/g.7606 Transcript_3642/m.7606 type:complete len:91 (+) Transcript_3642:3923-4195(+)